jgi:acetyl-CoA C-acetyltransferase
MSAWPVSLSASWQEMDTAYAGSLEVLQPDTLNKHLGLTGIPFTTLYNGCATGATC